MSVSIGRTGFDAVRAEFGLSGAASSDSFSPSLLAEAERAVDATDLALVTMLHARIGVLVDRFGSEVCLAVAHCPPDGLSAGRCITVRLTEADPQTRTVAFAPV